MHRGHFDKPAGLALGQFFHGCQISLDGILDIAQCFFFRLALRPST
jgi:hypothetical protein